MTRVERFTISLFVVVFVSSARSSACQAPAVPAYHLIGRISTDSGELGFLVIDSDSRQLYGVGNRVIDIDKNEVSATFPLPEHGVMLAPELHRGLGMDGTFFELPDRRILDSLHTDGFTSTFDAGSGRAFLFRRKTVVVDMRAGRVVDTLDIGGDPAAGVSDGHGHVFVNRIDADSIVVIDAAQPRVAAQWSVAPCTRPRGLAMDRVQGRLFVACDSMLAVLSATDGHVVALVRGVRGGNEIAFDSTTGLIFNPNGIKGGATISVIRESAPGIYSIVENVPTGPDGGRSLVVDTRTHRVYLATARFVDLLTVYVFGPS
jgi:phosphohistidine swiveling domain-containing protein